MTSILNIILYLFVYKIEVNKFWNTITNNKPKYLIDKTHNFHNILYSKAKEYKKDTKWKEIIEHVDFHNWKLVINEKYFILDETLKASYFLELISKYFDKKGIDFIELCDFIDLYEKNYYNDWKDYDFLKLSNDNIKKSYIKTINDNILKIYNQEVLEIKKNFIWVIQDSN